MKYRVIVIPFWNDEATGTRLDELGLRRLRIRIKSIRRSITMALR